MTPDLCRRCVPVHPWHGLTCTARVAIPGPAPRTHPCGCPGEWDLADDSEHDGPPFTDAA